MLDGLVRQDVEMLEAEQQAYLESAHSGRSVQPLEFNRALMSVQRLIRIQAQS